MTKEIFISLLFVFYVFIDELFAIKVCPNPWIPEDKSGKRGTFADGTIFDELSNTCGEMYIYNVTGESVRRLRWESGVSLLN